MLTGLRLTGDGQGLYVSWTISEEDALNLITGFFGTIRILGSDPDNLQVTRVFNFTSESTVTEYTFGGIDVGLVYDIVLCSQSASGDACIGPIIFYLGRPNRPVISDFRLTDDEQRFSVSWTVEDNPLSPITSFEGTLSVIGVNRQVERVISFTTNAAERDYALATLIESGNRYEIEICAVNGAGVRRCSDVESLIVNRVPSVPVLTGLRLTGDGQGLYVSWTISEEDALNLITGFFGTIRILGSDPDNLQVTRVFNFTSESTVTEYTFGGIDVGLVYDIVLCSQSASGDACIGPIIFYLGRPNRPVISDFRLTDDEQRFSVSWTVEDNLLSPITSFEGTLSVIGVNRQVERVISFTTNAAERDYALATLIESGNRYEIEICAVNGAGVRRCSDVESLIVNRVPLVPVLTGLRLTGDGQGLYVSWTISEEDALNLITGFFGTIRILGSDPDNLQVTRVFNFTSESTVTEYTFGGIDVGLVYDIVLCSQSASGDACIGPIIFYLGRPNRPVVSDFRLTDDEQRFSVSWTVEDNPLSPITSFEGTLSVIGVNRQVERVISFTTNAAERDYTLATLIESGNRYEIEICAVNGAGVRRCSDVESLIVNRVPPVPVLTGLRLTGDGQGLYVSWTISEEDALNLITGFFGTIRILGSDPDNLQVTRVFNFTTESTVTEYTFSGIDVGLVYDIVLCSQSASGDACIGPIIFYLGRPNRPVVSDFRLTDDEQRFSVSWTVEDNPLSPITSFEGTLSVLGVNRQVERVISFTTNAAERDYTLATLIESGNRYEIEICAVNGAGVRRCSDVESLIVNRVPLRPVLTGLRLTGDGQGLYVSWTISEEDALNLITGFFGTIRILGSDPDNLQVTRVFNFTSESTVTEYTFGGINVSLIYDIVLCSQSASRRCLH